CRSDDDVRPPCRLQRWSARRWERNCVRGLQDLHHGPLPERTEEPVMAQDPRVTYPPPRTIITPEPQLLGYQRLWPLASWATVNAGSSGVTYTEHADGIEWTIPPGPAD